MLWTMVAGLLILRLLSFSLHKGGLIHLLPVFVLVVVVIHLLSGGRGAASAVPGIDWVSLMFRGNLQ
jgi:hypothetical protein